MAFLINMNHVYNLMISHNTRRYYSERSNSILDPIVIWESYARFRLKLFSMLFRLHYCSGRVCDANVVSKKCRYSAYGLIFSIPE